MHIMNAGEGERHWDDGFYKISFRGVVEEPIKKAIPQPLYDGNKGRVFGLGRLVAKRWRKTRNKNK